MFVFINEIHLANPIKIHKTLENYSSMFEIRQEYHKNVEWTRNTLIRTDEQ